MVAKDIRILMKIKGKEWVKYRNKHYRMWKTLEIFFLANFF